MFRVGGDCLTIVQRTAGNTNIGTGYREIEINTALVSSGEQSLFHL